MAIWTEISEDARKAIISGAKDSIHGKSFSDLTKWRDEKLVKLLKTIYD